MYCALVFMFTHENIIFYLSLHAVSPSLMNESRDYALRACVYIYTRKHNLLPFIACCIALFQVIRKLV